MKKEKNIVRYSVSDLPVVTEAQRKKLRSAKRKAINFDDIPELTKEDFKRAVLMPPITDPQWKVKMAELSKGKKTKERTIHIDQDIDTWFGGFGKKSEERMNAALRVYMLAHESPRP